MFTRRIGFSDLGHSRDGEVVSIRRFREAFEPKPVDCRRSSGERATILLRHLAPGGCFDRCYFRYVVIYSDNSHWERTGGEKNKKKKNRSGGETETAANRIVCAGGGTLSANDNPLKKRSIHIYIYIYILITI